MSHNNTLPDLVIGDLHINPPIIQGGMGVAISSSRLAAAVSNEGALGVIAAVGSARSCNIPNLNYQEQSRRGIQNIFADAKKMTARPFGVNIMCVLSNYDELVHAAVEAGVEVIISGAGLPMHLPSLTQGSPVKLIPVVSSVRAASILCRTWWKKYHRLPDAFVVEGTAAGGHLGFSLEEISRSPSLESIVTEVVAYLETVAAEHGSRIPVIAAGGIFTGADIARFLKLGAAGVQMGTRFVCTDECDASDSYKQAYIDCTQEDIVIIKSPVGLPLRVLHNSFVEALLNDEKKPFHCTYRCLKNCNPSGSPYCIANALINAADGNLSDGIITCGANASRIQTIVPVRELIAELADDCLAALQA